MPQPTAPSADAILAAMGRAGHAHVSVTRGALPFVIPSDLLTTELGIVILTDHPSVLRGAGRHDIAAVQVEARLDDAYWSLSATGPLTESADGPAITAREALFQAECLSSPHGHSIDTLLRSGLTGRA